MQSLKIWYGIFSLRYINFSINLIDTCIFFFVSLIFFSNKTKRTFIDSWFIKLCIFNKKKTGDFQPWPIYVYNIARLHDLVMHVQHWPWAYTIAES